MNTDMNIDDEWLAFLEDGGVDSQILSPKQNENINNDLMPRLLQNTGINKTITEDLEKIDNNDSNDSNDSNTYTVTPSELYISTKTKIVYLNNVIDLNSTFWKIPVMQYGMRKNGVIKKQIKLQSFTKEELHQVLHLVNQHQMQGLSIEQFTLHNSSILPNNLTSNFKDVRKISIGLCRKDILSQRSKKKSAFYNCFVLILRIYHETRYKDVHVKIFNTGKMEIPGMQSDELFELVQKEILSILQPYYDCNLQFLTEKCDTVLINSNFYTGYNINRDKLYELLKYEYKFNATYDPCSYPGIQCKYNKSLSFMIFRTGSVLIVGKSTNEELFEVYKLLKNILTEKYIKIRENMDTPIVTHITTPKQIKIKKKVVYI